ncbi:MAG TPA: CBS domain-containing protein [Hyphomicrobiaceae bacterium]|nr:CBS domain-containing protein [Hyphomicrobiaceae bacterium]
MQAADIMTFGAATIRADAPVEEAARVMLQHRISGLPVMDNNGNLVGMVTEGDLLAREASTQRRRWLELVLGSVKPADGPRLAHLATVSEVMSRPVVTVREDTPVHEVADILQRDRIKRVPVVRGERVTGIVSRADVLRGLARLAEDMPAASAEDRALRQRVLDALAQVPKDGWRSVNVVVRNGTVELRGATADADLRQRLVTAVRGVPGVNRLDDRMVVVGPASGRT